MVNQEDIPNSSILKGIVTVLVGVWLEGIAKLDIGTSLSKGSK